MSVYSNIGLSAEDQAMCKVGRETNHARCPLQTTGSRWGGGTFRRRLLS
ncbi:MAG: hypothetical protein LBM73_02975 [Candidatus Nomurabacteria bacterium]|nr:hypothetical protein [Candidatus Nomurabacteria bacterium]